MKILCFDPRLKTFDGCQAIERCFELRLNHEYFHRISFRRISSRRISIRRISSRRISGLGMFVGLTFFLFVSFGLQISLAKTVQNQGSSETQPLQQFPYLAKVKSATAEIYSGPGKVHYPTGQLKTGDTVEVYRLDPGGWCAIRPPSGSFSLVPASTIKELEDSVGEIIEADVQAWVGTELGPVEIPLWQVKLKLGEQVELLGMVNWPEPEGFTTAWYQIASPSGEFRWIRQDDIFIPPALMGSQPSYQTEADLTDDPKIRTASQLSSWTEPKQVDAADFSANPASDAGTIAKVGYQLESEELDPVERPSQRSDSDGSNGSTLGWRRATRPIHQMDWNQSNPAQVESFGTSNSVNQEGIQKPPNRMASSRFDSRFDFEQLVPTQSSSVGPISNRLTELELRLNKEMLKEPPQWRLHDIREATLRVIDSTQDSIEKMQAQRFLEKLENCRRIRDNSVKIAAAPISIDGRSSSRQGDGWQSMTFEEEFSLGTQYDAFGRLNQLVREGGKREMTYVLQDENGKITHHVSPGPGMSLTSYVGKRVGIMGQRGYHTRLKLDHVTAATVVELKSR